MILLCFFFFFQAEDGIRDDLVTGVQTCALPIYRLERRREALGRVNPLAKEEYEEEKERLEELSTQRADLEASLEELEKLRAELTETVERRFEETVASGGGNFSEGGATLLPRRRHPLPLA